MKKDKKLNIFSCIIIIGVMLWSASCSKMDSTHYDFIKDGPHTYTAKADSLKIWSGKNRVKLSWLLISDRNITKCKVFWFQNGIRDSALVSVQKTDGVDTIETEIANLEENSYIFSVHTYDDEGNSSMAEEISGVVYGNNFRSTLDNRVPKTPFLFKDNVLLTKWNESKGGNVTTEVKYMNTQDQVKIIYLAPEADALNISDWKPGELVYFRSSYRPVSNALDTFTVNHYDSVYTELETELDKSKFKLIELPGDLNGNYYSEGGSIFKAPLAWDNNLSTYMISWLDPPLPNQSFTIDLGKSVKLNRFKMWGRLDYPDGFYAAGNIKKFEVWGRRDQPDGSGNWANWTKLKDCEIIKPSGLPMGQVSDADERAFRAGFEFRPSLNDFEVRYIRLKLIETWGGTGFFYIGEISLWEK